MNGGAAQNQVKLKLSHVTADGLTSNRIINWTLDSSVSVAAGSKKRSVSTANLVTSASFSRTQQKGFSLGLGVSPVESSSEVLATRCASNGVLIRLSTSPPLLIMASGSSLRRKRISSSATSFSRWETKGRKNKISNWKGQRNDTSAGILRYNLKAWQCGCDW